MFIISKDWLKTWINFVNGRRIGTVLPIFYYFISTNALFYPVVCDRLAPSFVFSSSHAISIFTTACIWKIK